MNLSRSSEANYSIHLKSHYRVQRHTSFVTPINRDDCFLVPEYILDIDAACNYIRNTSDCNDVVKLFDYLDFMVCHLHVDSSLSGITVMACFAGCILLIYMEAIYIIATFFLVPNFVTLSGYVNVLGFDYGMTFISMLLGLPEFLSQIYIRHAFHENDALLLSASIGEINACFSFGLAVVTFKRALRFKSMHFSRNMLLLIFGNIYLVELLRNTMTNFPQSYYPRTNAFIFLLIYLVYMIYIVVAHIRTNRKIPNNNNIDNDNVVGNNTNDDIDDQSRISSPDRLQRRHSIKSLESDEYSDHDNSIHEELKPWTIFFETINPYTKMEGLPMCYFSFVSTLYIACALLIPVVDKERPLNGWCKYIICISFITYPFHFKLIGVTPPYFYGLLFVGILASTLILLITHVQRIPKQHDIFSLMGVLISCTMLYIIDCEMDALLWQLLNYLVDWKGDGVAVLAHPWGNRLAVCVIVWALMTNGHIDMAVGMVFGFNLFITYMSFPIIVYNTIDKYTVHMVVTAEADTCYVFLLVTLFTTWLGVSITNFEIRMTHGIYVLILYAIFMTYVNMVTNWTVHSYGTHHGLSFTKDSAEWA